ncbi:hypothetical protein SNEBB_003740 [Seison nebaliae]|nr:hypothetical protein SNEBB_003740 [Seison nebaliae]
MVKQISAHAFHPIYLISGDHEIFVSINNDQLISISMNSIPFGNKRHQIKTFAKFSSLLPTDSNYERANQFIFSSDRRTAYLAEILNDGRIGIGKNNILLPFAQKFLDLNWSDIDPIFLTCHLHNEWCCWDIRMKLSRNDQFSVPCSQHAIPIETIQFLPNSSHRILTTSSSIASIFDLRYSKSFLFSEPLHNSAITSYGINQKHDLITADESGELKRWRINENLVDPIFELKGELNFPNEFVNGIEFLENNFFSEYPERYVVSSFPFNDIPSTHSQKNLMTDWMNEHLRNYYRDRKYRRIHRSIYPDNCQFHLKQNDGGNRMKSSSNKLEKEQKIRLMDFHNVTGIFESKPFFDDFCFNNTLRAMEYENDDGILPNQLPIINLVDGNKFHQLNCPKYLLRDLYRQNGLMIDREFVLGDEESNDLLNSSIDVSDNSEEFIHKLNFQSPTDSYKYDTNSTNSVSYNRKNNEKKLNLKVEISIKENFINFFLINHQDGGRELILKLSHFPLKEDIDYESNSEYLWKPLFCQDRKYLFITKNNSNWMRSLILLVRKQINYFHTTQEIVDLVGEMIYHKRNKLNCLRMESKRKMKRDPGRLCSCFFIGDSLLFLANKLNENKYEEDVTNGEEKLENWYDKQTIFSYPQSIDYGSLSMNNDLIDHRMNWFKFLNEKVNEENYYSNNDDDGNDEGLWRDSLGFHSHHFDKILLEFDFHLTQRFHLSATNKCKWFEIQPNDITSHVLITLWNELRKNDVARLSDPKRFLQKEMYDYNLKLIYSLPSLSLRISPRSSFNLLTMPFMLNIYRNRFELSRESLTENKEISSIELLGRINSKVALRDIESELLGHIWQQLKRCGDVETLALFGMRVLSSLSSDYLERLLWYYKQLTLMKNKRSNSLLEDLHASKDVWDSANDDYEDNYFKLRDEKSINGLNDIEDFIDENVVEAFHNATKTDEYQSHLIISERYSFCDVERTLKILQDFFTAVIQLDHYCENFAKLLYGRKMSYEQAHVLRQIRLWRSPFKTRNSLIRIAIPKSMLRNKPICSYCDLPLCGEITMCFKCCHGMHLMHMLEWLSICDQSIAQLDCGKLRTIDDIVQYDSNDVSQCRFGLVRNIGKLYRGKTIYCAAGCGCQCTFQFYTTNEH